MNWIHNYISMLRNGNILYLFTDYATPILLPQKSSALSIVMDYPIYTHKCTYCIVYCMYSSFKNYFRVAMVFMCTHLGSIAFCFVELISTSASLLFPTRKFEHWKLYLQWDEAAFLFPWMKYPSSHLALIFLWYSCIRMRHWLMCTECLLVFTILISFCEKILCCYCKITHC